MLIVNHTKQLFLGIKKHISKSFKIFCFAHHIRKILMGQMILKQTYTYMI